MTKEEKQNCWQFMQCGREPNGANVDKLNVCPAATAKSYNNIHNGVNAGRFCWKIAGTLCFDTVKGSSALSIVSCLQCPFFEKVKEEEGNHFV